MYSDKKIKDTSSSILQRQASSASSIHLKDYRQEALVQTKLLDSMNSNSIQLVKKGGKQQAGMPKKAKGGSKEKQQSKAQRAFNAISSYRSDFCAEYNVTLKDVTQYLNEGNVLHGHASADSNSKENSATTQDANHFVGWYRAKHDIEK